LASTDPFAGDIRVHVDGVLEQHYDEAAFLAETRPATVFQAHILLDELARFDARYDSNVAGLIVSGRGAWEFCEKQWDESDIGGMVVVVRVALSNGEFDFIVEKLSGSMAQGSGKQALAAALDWQDAQHLAEFEAKLTNRHEIGLDTVFFTARSRLRIATPAEVEQNLSSESPDRQVSALRAIGEMGHRSLLAHCHNNLRSDDENLRFWAAWSAVLVGDKTAAETLKPFVEAESPQAYRAIYLAPRALEAESCRAWLRELAQSEMTRRLALIGCGIAGDPMYIPTLIHQMKIPEYARVAGEAFSMITGVDLAYEDLDAEWPDGFEAGPSEDPADDNVELDADEDLPWPNAELIQEWWEENGRNLSQGARYLCGEPISEASCRRVLVEGFQRQRISAALELAIMNADEPLFEWRAPGFRQQEWLGLRKPRHRVS
jgi:uncharacterized protein (TIGR02270 family)